MRKPRVRFYITVNLAILGWLALPMSAPKLGVMHWPGEDHPIWGPRLEKTLRSILEADTGFGGTPDIEAIATRRHIQLSSSQFLDGGSKVLTPLFGVDQWVRLELVDANPEHRVKRERWMPWKAEETWALPLRLTVWEGGTGKVLFAGIVPGDETEKGNHFLPFRSYSSFSFFEQEALRQKLLLEAVKAARDTLARVVLGRAPTSSNVPPGQ